LLGPGGAFTRGEFLSWLSKPFKSPRAEKGKTIFEVQKPRRRAALRWISNWIFQKRRRLPRGRNRQAVFENSFCGWLRMVAEKPFVAADAKNREKDQQAITTKTGCKVRACGKKAKG
jgi:hypothetical protein